MKKSFLVLFTSLSLLTTTFTHASIESGGKEQRASLYCTSGVTAKELDIVFARPGTRLTGYINVYLSGYVEHNNKPDHTKTILSIYQGAHHIEEETNTIFNEEIFDLSEYKPDLESNVYAGTLTLAKIKKKIGRGGLITRGGFIGRDDVDLGNENAQPSLYETHAYLDLANGDYYEFKCGQKPLN